MSKLFAPDSLGRPNEGIHTNVGGVAIFDVAATVGASYWISQRMKWDFALTTVGMFALGQLAHWYYRVPTAATKELGLYEPEARVRRKKVRAARLERRGRS